jgi:hypothetical protein
MGLRAIRARGMKSEKKELKLFKVSGAYVRDFYLVGYTQDEVAQEARKILQTFRVSECSIEETSWFSSFKKQLGWK